MKRATLSTGDSFQPSEVAAVLGLDVGTVRRWCEWHKEHLSEGASPPPGGRRQLSAHDVETMKVIKELRAAGLATLAVNARLREVTIAVVDSPALQATAQEGPGMALQRAEIETYIQAVQGHMQGQIEGLRGEIARASKITAFALGALTTAIFFLLVLGLFVIFGR
jgi:DNA-binding transcriptional MerR regulator